MSKWGVPACLTRSWIRFRDVQQTERRDVPESAGGVTKPPEFVRELRGGLALQECGVGSKRPPVANY